MSWFVTLMIKVERGVRKTKYRVVLHKHSQTQPVACLSYFFSPLVETSTHFSLSNWLISLSSYLLYKLLVRNSLCVCSCHAFYTCNKLLHLFNLLPLISSYCTIFFYFSSFFSFFFLGWIFRFFLIKFLESPCQFKYN